MVHVIPEPANLEIQKGYFPLSMDTKIESPKELEENTRYLVGQIKTLTQLHLKWDLDKSPQNAASGIILLTLAPTEKLPKNGYQLSINPEAIKISANTNCGIFYGIQSLLQIIQSNKTKLPALNITDYPRYPYRGVHLDVCRHFFPVSFIKKYIDMLAMHKMNVFHWHLTEDQGWRIEIKKYPKLTTIGGFRKETIVGHAHSSQKFDGIPYGGFYTQEEIKEVVSYAQSREITIIPEIEMPGHSRAALAAYPELGCTGGPYEVATTWGIFEDVYCAGNEKVFAFMEDVLIEVMALFPSQYIHIGGDECPKTRWAECPKCQQRIKDESLKNEHELQSYFIKRIEQFLNAHGKKLIGWDEILEGGLAPEATVMSWRGVSGGLAAARSEHDVIMTPTSHCYFDYYQGQPEFEPLAIGGYLPLKTVYSFDPIPEKLEEKYHHYVIGGQANLWTEYMKTEKHVEYMLNPRLAAMAEALWTPREKKNWPEFQKKIQTHFKRLEQKKTNYSRGTFKIEIPVKPAKNNQAVIIQLRSEQYKPEIHYTTDGTRPTQKSNLYKDPFIIEETTDIQAAIFKDAKIFRGIDKKTITIHKALGAEVNVLNPPSGRFTDQGASTLVNGMNGTENLNDGNWLGFEKEDFEAVINLESEKEIQSIAVGFLDAYRHWIFLPKQVEIYTSVNGRNFKEISIVKNPFEADKSARVPRQLSTEFEPQKAQYIKIIARNIQFCPTGHPGAGKKAWLFVDEIIVE